jgi:uncharacterized protein YndB with AHSA1/START domain
MVAQSRGEAVEQDSIERTISIPLTPDEAWQFLTEREHLEHWLAPEVELEPVVGGHVRVVGDDGVERHGEVESIEEPRHLRFTWSAPDEDPSVVEITVEPDGEGSRIEISERRAEPVEALARVYVFEVAAEPDGPLLLAA